MASKPTLTDRIGDWALRSALKRANAKPYPEGVAYMGRLLERIGAATGYRKRVLDNLAMIYPNMSDDDRNHLAESVLDNFGRTLFELYANDGFWGALKSSSIVGQGVNAALQAKAEGRPVIFLTGHFGNHDAPRQMLTQKGLTIGGLFRPLHNPLINNHYKTAITSSTGSGPGFESNRQGTKELVRYLKTGGMVMVLFDVRVRSEPQIDFLGRPAHTALSPAELALKYNALLIPYWGIRASDGIHFNCIVDEPIAEASAIDMMTNATQRLETMVKSHPEQWFWVHNRWA